MTTNTYDALFTQTVTGSAVSSVTINLAGISGYTDLVLQCSLRTDTSTFNNMNFPSLRFNGDSTSGLYSVTNFYTRNTGSGNNTATGGSSSQNEINLGGVATSAMSSGIFSSYQIHLQNYANSSIYKTVLARIGTGGNITALDGVWASVGLWSNTNAITSISLTASSSGLFQIGSTFSLYGIRAEATTPAPKAIGGAIYSDDLYYYHAFGSSGVFAPTTSISADILVVAGGGCGGGFAGGGGGAGGLLGFGSQSLTATNYAVTVGAGGAGVAVAYNAGGGNNGSNSQFGGLTAAVGGGYGGPTGNVGIGVGNGGSGGGRGNPDGAGNGTAGQGFNGAGAPSPSDNGGGGGAGGTGTTTNGGTGGIGATSTTLVGGTAGPYAFINPMGAATGTGELSSGNYYYAGGGGGGCASTGGIGGGGAALTSGRASSGGGGGGACGATSFSGNGGSGVVIVRYLKA